MTTQSRRDFLKLSGALAGTALIPGSIKKALAIEPKSITGTLRDVEHIVVFMQENRSFDHYLGHLSGVRGFNDRFPVTLSNGRPVWFQPREESRFEVISPFRYDTTNPGINAQCIGGLPHTWQTTHGAINGGRVDQWAVQKTNMTMGYHVREDLPFHYALADAFTVCDQYFCSIPGNTHPNRMYLMTGTIDPLGMGGGPLLDNIDYITNEVYKTQIPPFTWTTYPERLEAAGISWKIYQQGTGFDNFTGNYGTNMLACFKNFIDAPVGSSLYQRAMSPRSLDQLKADVMADQLPQVSWLLPPAAFSEHPRFTPLYGASYIATILDALTSNPEVWSKTVLFIMYDENDGLFDHVVPPQPPTLPNTGLSTVDISLERHHHVPLSQKSLYTQDCLPYGLGPRVPMFVISPWSRGGFVNSQVFDHTSVLQFIERRFGVIEENISPWRRAVCGDLTSTLDFTKPNSGTGYLPDTADYMALADAQCSRKGFPSAPGNTGTIRIPTQEVGTRPARALPYELLVNGTLESSGFKITFRNAGHQGAHFICYTDDLKAAPRQFTVEAGKALSDSWSLSDGEKHMICVYGPNGFFRRFSGSAERVQIQPEIDARYDADTGDVHVTIVNKASATITVMVTDMAYGQNEREQKIGGGESVDMRWGTSASAHWYDLQFTVKDSCSWKRRIAGHIENGKASITDPAATAPVTEAL